MCNIYVPHCSDKEFIALIDKYKMLTMVAPGYTEEDFENELNALGYFEGENYDAEDIEYYLHYREE